MNLNVFTKTATYKDARIINGNIFKSLKNLNICNEPVIMHEVKDDDISIYFIYRKSKYIIYKDTYEKYAVLCILGDKELLGISHLSENITNIMNSLLENNCNVDNLPFIIDKLSNHLQLCVNFILEEIPNLSIIEHTKSANSI